MLLFPDFSSLVFHNLFLGYQSGTHEEISCNVTTQIIFICIHPAKGAVLLFTPRKRKAVLDAEALLARQHV